MKYLIIFMLTVTTALFAGSFDDGYGENIQETYISFSLGGASNGYSSDYVDFLKNSGDMDYGSIFVDFGIYFPMDTHLLVGAAISISSDHFSEVENSEKYIDYTTSLIGVSALYFLDYIEEGIFLRGDLGVTSLSADFGDYEYSESRTNDEFGLGILVGVGYSLPLTWGSVTGNLLFSHKKINDSISSNTLSVSTLSLSVGILW